MRLRMTLGAKLGVEAYRMVWQQGELSDLEAVIRQLLNSTGATEPEPYQQANRMLPEPLSERECEVLHLLAEGLLNAEIAPKLYLPVATVKVHTRNIYGKLAVGSRTQAVAQARRLNLL